MTKNYGTRKKNNKNDYKRSFSYKRISRTGGMEEDKLFQFTRHLNSCNNINEGFLMGKDYEPSASLMGIKDAMNFLYEDIEEKDLFSQHEMKQINVNKEPLIEINSQNVMKQEEIKSKNYTNFILNKNEPVYVSCLLRTWITAYILYGCRKIDNNLMDNQKPNELTLIISPFLKEYEKKLYINKEVLGKKILIDKNVLERGNYPIRFDQELILFKKFLEKLPSIFNVEEYDFVKKVKIQFYDIKDITVDFVINANNIIDINVDTKNKNYFKSICNFYRQRRIFNKGRIVPNKYNVEGDLNKFMDLDFNNNKYSIKVITHSQVIKSYLKTKNPNTIETNNLMTFLVKKKEGLLHTFNGKPDNYKSYKDYENTNKNLSLCNTRHFYFISPIKWNEFKFINNNELNKGGSKMLKTFRKKPMKSSTKKVNK
jgi:hypothetical protein